MNWTGLLRVLAPRLLGGVASAAAGWIFVHSHGAVTLDPTQMVELGTTMILTYGAGHTAAAAKINPAQAATPDLAEQGKVIDTEIKAENKAAETVK